MKCPTCGEETEGRNHNGRGLRCTACWALLPTPVPADAPPPVEAIPFDEPPAKPAPVKATRRRGSK